MTPQPTSPRPARAEQAKEPRTLRIRGAFWTADAELLEVADPREHGSLRHLFLDTTPRSGGGRSYLLPGTMLALVWVSAVTIEPAGATGPRYAWKRGAGKAPKLPAVVRAQDLKPLLASGALSLLVLDADPARWDDHPTKPAKRFPDLGCVAGEIPLDDLTAEAGARDKLYRALALTPAAPGDRSGPAALAGALTVHSGGLSLYGETRLPWRTDPLRLPLALARAVPDTGGRAAYRMTVETERLTGAERAALQDAWTALSRAVNPSAHLGDTPPAPAPGPSWVTLEIAGPTRLPRLFWPVDAWQEQPASLPVRFEPEELAVLVSDQPLHDPRTPPTSIARVVPETVGVTEAAGVVTLTLGHGTAWAAGQPRADYAAVGDAEAGWRENWTAVGVDLAFDPVETARDLREAQGVPAPEWARPEPPAVAEPVDPAVLWAFLPLADGWAQLPVPNLSEDVYLRADLAKGPTDWKPAIEGAVSYGNDAAAPAAGEHGWRVSLTDAGGVEGTWRLERDPQSGRLGLTRVTLRFAAPDLTVDGLLWMSTERPTEEDALPALDDFVSGLRPLAMRTVHPARDAYPAVVTTRVRELELSRGPAGAGAAAALGAWSVEYGADAEQLRKMVEAAVLPADTFAALLPLVWRRHPALPLVQALPLTQSKLPPNHPSASRQLAPFELSTAAAGAIQVPAGWRFGVTGADGAARWPVLQAAAAPAQAWRERFDLPMASLSVPGLVLDPRAAVLADESTGLGVQYRFDLPFADEVNALAQLPKLPAGPSLAPARRAPSGPPPLTRDRFASHWRRAAERAGLAAVDAAAALARDGDERFVRNLIEPLDWPVAIELGLSAYPGALRLSNADGDAAQLVLEGDQAIEGVSGSFAADAAGLRRLAPDSVAADTYDIVAGSMAARREDGGAYRDQRGLLRSATAVGGRLLRTPVALAEDAEGHELASALEPVPLTARARASRLWFRDLPLRGGVFDRAQVRSAQAEDVNDPEALSRERGHLAGYEWRLELLARGHLDMFGLEFYPLTLERLEVEGDAVRRVQIDGRLQLPLAGAGEATEVANAVRATFEAGAGALELTELTAVGPGGDWPLGRAGGELDDAPRLRWRTVALTDGRDGAKVGGVELRFMLFGAEWRVPLDDLTLTADGGPIDVRTHPAPAPAPVAIAPADVALGLDAGQRRYSVSMLVAVRLGRGVAAGRAAGAALDWRPGAAAPAAAGDARAAFAADVRFGVLGDGAGQVACESAVLFDDLPLAGPDAGEGAALDVAHNQGALEFAWAGASPPAGAADLQVLPGMHLSATAPAPGFAALSFAAAGAVGAPQLRIDSAFAEATLQSRWGTSLLDRDPAAPLAPAAVFASSAGDVSFGYTGRWRADGWRETLLLNGCLEVRNVVSWPTELGYDGAATRLSLPPARDGRRALAHTRHTLRMLLNQHEVPPDVLALGSGALLFDLDRARSWQPLAVVEHQLLEVVPSADLATVEARNDRRWTAVQEVRLLPPARLKALLQRVAALETIDAGADRTDPIPAVLSGYFGAGLRARLAEGNAAELDRLPAEALVVEASTLHWVKQAPAETTAGAPPAAATTLQFLPQGTVSATLSGPADYGPTDPRDPRWLLLATPFVGRLQGRLRDALTPSSNSAPPPSPLQVDPILVLGRARAAAPGTALPDLALALASWGDSGAVTIDVSGLDAAVARSFARLDPAGLEVSWFRYQHPGPEPAAYGVASVLASAPATPARMSRPAALAAALDASAERFPPAPGEQPPPGLDGDDPVWRRHALLAPHGISTRDPAASPPYGWPFTAVQVATSDLGRAGAPASLRRYAAATALPTWPTPKAQRVGLAISPYAGLRLDRVDEETEPAVLFAELLCLDRSAGQLAPVATRAWEVGADGAASARSAAADWAREVHRRQAPESPIAMLRYREIRRPAGDAPGAAVATAYSFAIVPAIDQPPRLAARAFALRSAPDELRFREGQFGGGAMPPALHGFELAPPQVTGVQPLRLASAPDPARGRNWPWGLTALRLAVRYTGDGRPVIGKAGAVAETTVWWQAPGHAVQFRSAAAGAPAAGLPPRLRAPAIKSLLPVVPAPPMPAVAGSLDGAATEFERWQPVLPGSLHYFLLGARSGAPLAVRHALVRQPAAAADGGVVVSGSVPVQHRVPRPLALPPTSAASRAAALRTWAGHFDPEGDLLVTRTPADETFYAACGDDAACALRLTLAEPARGAIGPGWDGTVAFAADLRDEAEAPATWDLGVELVHDSRRYAYGPVAGEGSVRRFAPAEADAEAIHLLASAQRAGSAQVQVRARPDGRPHATAGGRFWQTLSFPLRIAGAAVRRAPLEPAYVHFEDPEYNRRLASAPARTAAAVETMVGEEKVARTLTLAADRRQYNPDGRLAARWDWAGPPLAVRAALRISSVDAGGVVRRLRPDPHDATLDDLPAGALVQLQLDRLAEVATGRRAEPTAGQSIQLELFVTDAGRHIGSVFLMLGLVEQPVTPAPEAAYALLRRSAAAAGAEPVECVRFAWGPNPDRIELICPEDLRGDVVRRRAVFHLRDAARIGTAPRYAVQKIARDGATHIPDVAAAPG